MAFRLCYQVQVMWVGPGLGPMGGALAPPLPQGPAGGAQVIEFINQTGGQNSITFLAADITTLLAAMSVDLSAQMNAVIARIQAFSTGTG